MCQKMYSTFSSQLWNYHVSRLNDEETPKSNALGFNYISQPGSILAWKTELMKTLGSREPDTAYSAFLQLAKEQLSQGMKIASRSLMSMFSSTKYTQAAMPITGATSVLEQLLNENVKSVVDSEVEMFDSEALLAAVNKVNNHKTKGRLVLITGTE